jgi:hypothetical protein
VALASFASNHAVLLHALAVLLLNVLFVAVVHIIFTAAVMKWQHFSAGGAIG